MAGTAVLKVLITADSKQAASELGKSSAGIGKWGKVAGAAVVGGLAVAGAAVVKFGISSVKAAQESETAQKRLEAIFKSMGDTTGWSAKQADKYASALSKQIGVDDEVIKQGQAKLATFGNVSNKTAIMSGVFDRATAASADLAAAGFGSIESNAVLMGKALQDPIKGISALSRVGVTLTDQQKKQATAMAEAGDIAGAQAIILKAVESQVKGTAAATATGSQKMAVAWGEIQESVGRALLPVLQALADVLLSVVLPAIQKLAGQLAQALGPHLTKLIGWIKTGLLPAFKQAFAVLVSQVVPAFLRLVKVVGPQLMPIIKALGQVIKGLIVPAFKIAAVIIKTAYTVLANLLAPILKALAPLFTRLGKLVRDNQTFFNRLVQVLKVVGIVLGFVAKVLGVTLGFAIKLVVALIIRQINVIEQLVRIAARVVSAFRPVGSALRGAFEGVAGVIESIISAVQRLIGWISKIHVPKIDLPGPLLAPAPPGGASAGRMAATTNAAMGRSARASTGGVTINVNGALDAEGVARQIRKLLVAHEVRMGRSAGIV